MQNIIFIFTIILRAFKRKVHIKELIIKIKYTMSQIFKLSKGEILLDEDKIIIKDDAKKQKWMLLLFILLPTIYAIRSFVRSIQTRDQFDYWYGSILGLFGILFLVWILMKSVRSDISLKEVKSMKIKQRFSRKILVIKLKNNRLRQVTDIENADALERYIKTNSLIK